MRKLRTKTTPDLTIGPTKEFSMLNSVNKY